MRAVQHRCTALHALCSTKRTAVQYCSTPCAPGLPSLSPAELSRAGPLPPFKQIQTNSNKQLKHRLCSRRASRTPLSSGDWCGPPAAVGFAAWGSASGGPMECQRRRCAAGGGGRACTVHRAGLLGSLRLGCLHAVAGLPGLLCAWPGAQLSLVNRELSPGKERTSRSELRALSPCLPSCLPACLTACLLA